MKRAGVNTWSWSWGPALRTTAGDDRERMVVERGRPRGTYVATSYMHAQLCQPCDVAAHGGTCITTEVGLNKPLWSNG